MYGCFTISHSSSYSPFSHVQGQTGNLAHLGIEDLSKTFFFGSGKLADIFPEVFEKEVPERAVALVATAVRFDIIVRSTLSNMVRQIKCCLRAYEKGYWDKKHDFSEEEYLDTYNGLLKLIEQLKLNATHWRKFCRSRRKWASDAR